jgi:purine-cytosine permease-like protein
MKPQEVLKETTMKQEHTDEKAYFFDKPKNVRIVSGICLAILMILLIAEFFIHKHPHFAWEAWPQFYAVFGFVAFVFVVFVAKYILRPLVGRREDYYD